MSYNIIISKSTLLCTSWADPSSFSRDVLYVHSLKRNTAVMIGLIAEGAVFGFKYIIRSQWHSTNTMHSKWCEFAHHKRPVLQNWKFSHFLILRHWCRCDLIFWTSKINFLGSFPLQNDVANATSNKPQLFWSLWGATSSNFLSGEQHHQTLQ